MIELCARSDITLEDDSKAPVTPRTLAAQYLKNPTPMKSGKLFLDHNIGTAHNMHDQIDQWAGERPVVL